MTSSSLFSMHNDSVRIAQRLQLIGGDWTEASDGRTIDVENPATKQVIHSVPRGNGVDVDRAVKAARAAFPAWRKVSLADRSRLFHQIADALEKRVEELARLVAHETGNALRTQTRPEAQMAVQGLRYFAGVLPELKGATLPLGDGLLSYTRREPLGVVGAIIPWNAPISIGVNKIAPALCAGNTMVLKVAEDAPFGVLLIAEICNQFLPKGVLNVVTGIGEECGAALAAHPQIDKISFTGSTSVGKLVMAAAAKRILPVSLELGGKSPAIVYDDADAAWAVEGVASAMRFTRQSQSCTAGSRLFLHRKIYDSFLDKLTTFVSQYKLGDPLEEATDMGSLISRKQFETVTGYIADGLKTPSAKLVVGGLPPTEGPLAKGYFTQPTIFASESNEWRLAQEEIFGPVLVAIPWSDEEQVIRWANESHYGLAGYVFSGNGSRGLRTAHALDAGWVQVNQGKGQLFGQPYGGFKQSGLGKECSIESMLDSFTRLKNVTLNLDV